MKNEKNEKDCKICSIAGSVSHNACGGYGDALRMADVDGDGAVTAIDASLILRKSVGAIETFPAESLAVDNAEPDSSSEGKTLVVYYSATGSTRSVAEYIASAAAALYGSTTMKA